jgi:hypothetical protein
MVATADRGTIGIACALKLEEIPPAIARFREATKGAHVDERSILSTHMA